MDQVMNRFASALTRGVSRRALLRQLGLATRLSEDFGKFSFRQWQSEISFADKGSHSLMVRCTNDAGDVQPDAPNWNNSGFMRHVIETVQVNAI